jgi:hypothetical protein
MLTWKRVIRCQTSSKRAIKATSVNQAHRQMSASLGVEICCKRRRFTRMPIALLAPLKWILLD